MSAYHDDTFHQPDGEVIGMLRDLMEMAQAGTIAGLAVVTVRSPKPGEYEGAGTGFAGLGVKSNLHAALGGVTMLRRRIEDHLIAAEKDVDGPGGAH